MAQHCLRVSLGGFSWLYGSLSAAGARKPETVMSDSDRLVTHCEDRRADMVRYAKV